MYNEYFYIFFVLDNSFMVSLERETLRFASCNICSKFALCAELRGEGGIFLKKIITSFL